MFLVFGLENLPGVLSRMLYDLSRLFDRLFLLIWTGLARIVDAIEGVFRNLAGVGGDGEVKDMAGEIITNKMVQTVFNNLVGVSAALLIFFTIVKIVQQQYKEKEGGNPYIIVFRMFKGMLMFFFVTAAVLVGLYASGVVFRALDDATKNGAEGVSGQIFTAMAADANRLRKGNPGKEEADYETADEYYYARVGGSGDGMVGDGGGSLRYTIVDVSGATASDAQAQAWYDAIPSNHWGVVNSDGTVTPLNIAAANLATLDSDFDIDKTKLNFKDTVYDNIAGETNKEFSADSGNAHGSAGYKNDILSAVDTKLQPAIDVEWSPIQIVRNVWKLKKKGDVVRTDIPISIMGNMTNIPMGFQNVVYEQVGEVNEKVEGGEEVFSISMHGKAALQGPEVGAQFDLDVFSNEMPVEKIMANIVANNLLVRLVNKLVGEIPDMPLWFYIGPVSFNMITLASTMLEPMIKALLNSALYTLTMGGTENYQDFIKIEFGSADIPITSYLYDCFDEENWQDLWKQVTNSWDTFKEQLNSSYEEGLTDLDEAKKECDKLVGELQQQEAWLKWKGLVDQYNNEIRNPLALLLNNAADYLSDDFSTRSAEEREKVESSIEESWQTLLKKYVDHRYNQSTQKPSAYQATAMVKHLYLPVFETQYTKTSDQNMKAEDIVAALQNGKKLTINLVNNPSGGQGLYRLVDWAAYTSEIQKANKNYVDVYETKSEPYAPSYYLEHVIDGTFGITLPTKPNTLIQGNTFSDAAAKEDLKKGAGAEGAATASLKAASVSDDQDPAADNDPWHALVARVRAIEAEKAANGEANTDQTTTTPDGITNEFAKNIVTFRRLGLSAQESDTSKDIKALKKWINASGTLGFGGSVTITPTYTLTAEDLDSYMDKRNSGRVYLTLADATKGDCSSTAAQTKYVGTLGYTSYSAITALYDIGEINWVIGFLGMTVAVGVYLNFTFGLIQRAVNMAVLYVMSPVTIAFYPFDDGQRFNNSFVKQFYKETISAYAIIISLNIFFLLITPVRKAAISMTSSSLMGTLALVAFISMLPKIRDTITELFGAASIQSKGLGQMFKDSYNATGIPGALNATKKVRDGVGKFAGGLIDRRFKNAAARRQKRDEKAAEIQSALAAGEKVSGRKQAWLDKYKNKQNALKDREERMKKAMAAGKNSAEFKNLSMGEQRRAKQLMKAAAERAKEEQKKGDIDSEAKLRDLIKNGETQAVRDNAEKRLAELEARKNAKDEKGNLLNKGKSIDDLIKTDRQKELLGDKKFRDSVSGVMAHKQLGKALQDKFKYTLLGDVAETLFHPATGMLANSNTSVGKLIKWMQPSEQDKRLRDMTSKEQEWRAARNDIDEVKTKQLTAASEGLLQAEQSKNDAIKRIAANKQAEEMATDVQSNDFKKRYVDQMTKQYIEQKGMHADFARDKAKEDYKKKSQEANAEEILTHELGLKTRAEMAEDLYRGIGDTKIDDKYLKAATQDFNNMSKKSTEALKASRKELSAENKAGVKTMVADLAKRMNLSQDVAKGLDNLVVEAVNSGDSIDLITNKIMGHLPAGITDEASIKRHLTSSDFASKVTKMQFDLGSENALINGALEYNKKIDKAREWAYQDLNVDIGSESFQNFFQAYRRMFDKDMAGGLQQQEVELLARYKGDTSNAAYQRELNALQEKFSQEYDNAFERVGSRHDARMYDYSVRQIEREQAERVTVLGKQYQKRIKYQLDVNMSPTAKNVMTEDSVLRTMKQKGNYTEAATKMNEAIEAAIKKDFAALQNSGLDHETITQFEAWAKAGDAGLKELRSIMDYNDLTRKFFGNAEGISGGNSTQAVRNQMAAIFRVVENKEVTEFLESQLKAFQGQEGSIRAALAKTRQTITAQFSGNTWETAAKYLDITDADGNKVTNLGAYFADCMDRIASGGLSKTSPEYEKAIDSLSTLMNDWQSNPELAKLMAGNRAGAMIESAIKALSDGFLANDYASQVINIYGKIGDTKRDAFEIWEKLEEGQKK